MFERQLVLRKTMFQEVQYLIFFNINFFEKEDE
jgi:hypothetical protein